MKQSFPDVNFPVRLGKVSVALLVLLLTSVEKHANAEELTMYVHAIDKECILRGAPFLPETLTLFLDEKDGIPSLEYCVAVCKTSEVASMCDAVAYGQDTQKCMILHYGEFDEDMVRRVADYQTYYVIEDCHDLRQERPAPAGAHAPFHAGNEAGAYGGYGYTEQIELPVLQLICDVDIRGEGALEGIKSTSIHDDIQSFVECLTICKVSEDQSPCVAAHYSVTKKRCKLMVADANVQGKYDIEGDETVGYIGECRQGGASALLSDSDSSEESQDEDGRREYLPQTREWCRIREHERQSNIHGFEILTTEYEIHSWEICMFYCRTTTNTPPCAAIQYMKPSRKCTTYAKMNTSNVNISQRNSFYEILECEKELPDVPVVPVKYFLPHYKEVCKAEVYRTYTLDGWEQLPGVSVKVKSDEECIELCRVRRRDKCEGVLFNSEQECTPMKQTAGAVAIPLGRSSFVKIIQCKYGAITDVLA
uniref:Apple domain-containing protein n=1 Tax=Trichuris muris TaxID=70415 RepID=A0A5S6QNG5_TRIMR